MEAVVSKYIDLELAQEIFKRNATVQRVIYNAIIENEDYIRELIEDLDLSQLEQLFNDPLPKAEMIDEVEEVLFDSKRDYLEQVQKFKQYLSSRED